MTNFLVLLVALDFEKAFDSLNWNFLFKTLESFNFGPSFIFWIKTLYNNACCCIMNNDYASDFSFIKRGARQGDHYPLIYLLLHLKFY